MNALIVFLLSIFSFSVFAQNVVYTNNEGCVVESEQRANGVILYVSKDDKKEIVGHGNDYSFGDFAYCADEKTQISSYEGAKGTHILIACSEHENGNKVTRGRVDISIMAGKLSEVKIDGQIKGLLFWKKDSDIECSNLVQE